MFTLCQTNLLYIHHYIPFTIIALKSSNIKAKPPSSAMI